MSLSVFILVSGFSANTTLHNDADIIIYCQHTSFNFSVSPMRIKSKDKDEEYGHCFPNSCPDKICSSMSVTWVIHSMLLVIL